jgi:hypothetical protein
VALPLNDLISWLEETITTVPVMANWMPDSPDAVVVATGGPGGPPQTDGAFEPHHIHIRCRATTDAAAESTALAIHQLLVADGSTQMGGTHVVSVESAAGPPAFLFRDASARTTYIATYLFVTPT